MGFDLSAAMSGAGAGAALGPWGAIGGGLLGGFMGGMAPKPKTYTKEDMMATMKPYTDMLDDYKDRSLDMLDPNSAANRGMKQQLNQQSMDQMGLANIMAQRADAANPYSGGSGVANQIAQNNMAKYGQQGTQAFQGYMQGQQQQGMANYGQTLGQYNQLYGSAANLEAANLGNANKLAAQKHESMMGAFGGFMGGGEGGGFGQMAGLLSGFAKGPGGTPQYGVDPNFIGPPPPPSDKRLKENIEYITTSLEGFKVYEFDYKNKDGRYRGVMADDMPTHPSVTKDSKGFYRVDYSKLDVDFERIS